MVEAVAVAFSMAWPEDTVQDRAGTERARAMLAGFRGQLYRCLGKRRDALFELADAVLCKQDRVHMAAELSLEPECRRGHGAVYDALNCGQVQIGRLRRALAGLPLPAWPDGRIRLAVDVSNWLRPDAATSPDRLFCHCYARGKGNAQLVPGWPYSLVAALEPGRTSWTLPLDVIRLGPADDATEVTAAQVREVIGRLAGAGHWHDGDPDILVVFDSGYDLTRLAWLLADLPAGCTSNWPAAAAGKTTTACCRSSRAPSSGLPSITCPATAARNRYGCGPPAPARPAPRWTAPGRRSCAASISNTRSGS
jgi:hypothetical protein